MGASPDKQLLSIVTDLVSHLGRLFVDDVVAKLELPALPKDARTSQLDSYSEDLLQFQEWCEHRDRSFRQEMKRLVHECMSGDSKPGSPFPQVSPVPPGEASQSTAPTDHAADLKPASLAPKRRSGLVRCLEHPGRIMTLIEAVTLVGGNKDSLTACLAPSSPARGRYKGLHFYRDGDPAPSDLPAPASQAAPAAIEQDLGSGYVRRRGGSDVMPVNGGRLPAAENPTPQELRADPISEPALHKRLQRDQDDRGLHMRQQSSDSGSEVA